MSRCQRLFVAVALSAIGIAPAAAGALVPSSSARSLFARTLLTVRDDPALEGNFQFGDVEAQRALAGIPAGGGAARNRIWLGIAGDGTAMYRVNPGKYAKIGVNPLYVDVALSVGTPEELAIEARGGVNPSGLRALLLRVGAKPGIVAGHAGLVWGAEGSVHPSALPDGLGGLGEYDRTVLGPNLVVAGRRSGPVGDLVGGGRTYKSNPVMVATVNCLGDVVAAVGVDQHGTEVAAGVLRPASASSQPIEEICAVRSGSAESADAYAARLRKSLDRTTTTVPSSLPLVRVLTRSTVSEGAADSTHFAHATLYDRPNQAAGVSITALDVGTISAMLAGA
jgi:hypothetical protein